jgi:hypothetical protein
MKDLFFALSIILLLAAAQARQAAQADQQVTSTEIPISNTAITQ